MSEPDRRLALGQQQHRQHHHGDRSGSLDGLATVALPADLVALGGKPHNVILDPHGRHAFVTMVGLMGENDFLVHYDTSGFAETGRLAVGKDTHVSIGRRTCFTCLARTPTRSW